MNQEAQRFDPQQVLLEHKKFFEDNKAAFSPAPKRIITPNESEERTYKLRGSDYKDLGYLNPNQNPSFPQANQNLPQLNQEKPEKELLIMTIEIGDGNRDTIRVFEDDDPYDLATEFCQTHGLNPQIIEPLAQNIYANIEKVLEERAQTANEETNEYNETGTAAIGNTTGPGSDSKGKEQEVFKDLGLKTGEFKSFNEHGSDYPQQIKAQQDYYNGHPDYNNGYKHTFQENDRENVYSHPSHPSPPSYPHVREEKTFDEVWEGSGKGLTEHTFNTGQSFDAGRKGIRYSHQETLHSGGNIPSSDEGSRKWTDKGYDTSNRIAYLDGVSDQRRLNGNNYPEPFQSEEEYLEYIIASQYGGHQKNLRKK